MIRSQVRSLRRTLDLLLGKRLALFATADVVVVLWTLIAMMLDTGDEPRYDKG